MVRRIEKIKRIAHEFCKRTREATICKRSLLV